MKKPWPLLAVSFALAGTGCSQPEYVDEADVCFEPSSDRIVVRASWGCASDHKGAELSCRVEPEGDVLRVTSKFIDGKDPNEACADAMVTTCESEPLATGKYTVVYGEESFKVMVPNEDEQSCAEEM